MQQQGDCGCSHQDRTLALSSLYPEWLYTNLQNKKNRPFFNFLEKKRIISE